MKREQKNGGRKKRVAIRLAPVTLDRIDRVNRKLGSTRTSVIELGLDAVLPTMEKMR